MKKLLLIPFFIFTTFMLLSNKPVFDDTAALQALFNAGDCTLLPFHTYTVSAPLNVPHTVNMNNATIISTMTGASQPVIKLTADGAGILNGTIQGPWDFTTAGNSSTGYYGIRVLANNCVISSISISQFSSYGIFCGPYNNLTITHCNINKTGFIGFFYDSEANTTGGTFTYNTIDRSMISPTTILDATVDIRASTADTIYSISGWLIKGNTFKMPLSPSANSNEDMEIRWIKNSLVDSNVFSQGTIGCSVVRGSHVTVSRNKFDGQKFEAIEFADSHNCASKNNSIKNTKDGFLLDGGVIFCKFDTLYRDTVRTASTGAVHTAANTKRIVIEGGDFTTVNKALNLQKTDSITLINTKIDGQGVSNTYGVFLDNSPGHITINSGSIVRCSYAVFAYSTTTSQLVDNNIGTNVLLTTTPIQFGSTFSNGARYGANNHFNFASLVFNPLPAKTYGDLDFLPGATSTSVITYTSGNTAVATIVSSKIHIVSAGTAVITASDGATSVPQTLTVSKAPLVVVANNFRRKIHTANPTFTVTYSGFVNGETSSVLTHAPVLSTTANTSSPVGNYAITNTSTAAANYAITNKNGILSVYGATFINVKVIVLK